LILDSKALFFKIQEASNRATTLSSLVGCIQNSLCPPILCDSENFGLAFRYEYPNRLNLILLKSARIVSTFNACLFLVTKGYTQEIATLLRVIIDFKAAIDFLSRDETEDKAVQSYVDTYFENVDPSEVKSVKKLPTQKFLHNSIADHMKDTVGREEFKKRFGEADPSQMLSKIYVTFSGYVHGSYPALMDMMSGVSAQLDMYGQPDSPKDNENMEALVTILGSVELTFCLVITRLKIWHMLEYDPEVKDWYWSRVKKNMAG
jgi:hypothetical protein